MNKHRIGALIAAGVLTLTFASTALATDEWDWQGKDNLPCEDGGYWVLNQIPEGSDAPTLTVDGIEAELVKQPNDGVAHYESVPVDEDSVVVLDPQIGQLQLSHCIEVTTTTSTETTETSTTDTETTETTSTVETETTSTTETTETTDTTETTETTSTVETETTGSVSESSESKEDKTPPSTDTIGSGDSGTPGGSLWALLVGAAGVLAGVLLLTPRGSRTRS